MTFVPGHVYTSASYVVIVLWLQGLRAFCLCLSDSSMVRPNWTGRVVPIDLGRLDHFEQVWP